MIDPAAVDLANVVADTAHGAGPAAALAPAVAILAAGLAALLVSKFTRLSSIVGFLIAGIILGDQGGFGLLDHDSATIHLIAELGVVFLLFDIGLHFSVRELQDSRKDLLALAPLQMALCTAAFSGVLWAMGLDPALALIVGAGFALSSTAVVARLLAEGHLSSCPLGKSSLSILVFQDVVAIFLLIFAGSLGEEGTNIALLAGLALVKALIAFAAALVMGRYVAKPAFQFLTDMRVDEALPIVALLIILASAAATALAGLSLTLGAFLAGMIVAHTPYRTLVQTEVRPFRALLLSFFFMSVGLGLDTQVLIAQAPLIIALAVGLLVIKSVLIAAAALASGWSRAGAARLAALLAQASEFVLVILGISAVANGIAAREGFGVAGAQLVSVLIAAAALTLALAPAWSWLGKRASVVLATRAASSGRELVKNAGHANARNTGKPVLIIGLTEAGRLAVDALRKHNFDIIMMEHDADRYAEAESMGYAAHFGDTADMRFWTTVGANAATAVVLGEARYETSRALTPLVRVRFPELVRFVAVQSMGEFVRHNRLGMRAHLLDREPEGVNLVVDLLRHLDLDEDDIKAWRDSLDEVRNEEQADALDTPPPPPPSDKEAA